MAMRPIRGLLVVARGHWSRHLGLPPAAALLRQLSQPLPPPGAMGAEPPQPRGTRQAAPSSSLSVAPTCGPTWQVPPGATGYRFLSSSRPAMGAPLREEGAAAEITMPPGATLDKVADPKPGIRSQDLVINRTPSPKPKPELEGLKFAAVYTDHMLHMTWTQQGGWGVPRIDPLAPFSMHPCAQVLHYAMGCFEGMKAYRGPDGRVHLFRPGMNMARLAGSSARLGLPPFDQGEVLECLKALLREEREWVPAADGYSIYMRPTFVATSPFLGIGPPSEARLFCVLSPVGPYFPGGGVAPVALYVDAAHVRAFPGGVGDKKVAGNYAPTIVPQVEAAKRGCAQVLYVLDDGHEGGGLIGESGAMNVFFLLKNEGAHGGMELVTPPLDGTVLPGVTRDSALQLVRSWGEIQVSERKIRMHELEQAHAEGRLLEMFGTGTAVVVQPIAALVKADGSRLDAPFDAEASAHWTAKPRGAAASGGEPAASEPFCLTARVYMALTDIQFGHVAGHEWSVPVED